MSNKIRYIVNKEKLNLLNIQEFYSEIIVHFLDELKIKELKDFFFKSEADPQIKIDLDDFTTVGSIENIFYYKWWYDNDELVNLTNKLKEHFKINYWRRVKGDGNCFFRSVMLQYIEYTLIKCVLDKNSDSLLFLIKDILFEEFEPNKKKFRDRTVTLLLYIVSLFNKSEFSKMFEFIYIIYNKIDTFEKTMIYWLKLKLRRFLRENFDVEINGLKFLNLIPNFDYEDNGQIDMVKIEKYIEEELVKMDEFTEGYPLYITPIILRIDLEIYMPIKKGSNYEIFFNYFDKKSGEIGLKMNENYLIQNDINNIKILFRSSHYECLYNDDDKLKLLNCNNELIVIEENFFNLEEYNEKKNLFIQKKDKKKDNVEMFGKQSIVVNTSVIIEKPDSKSQINKENIVERNNNKNAKFYEKIHNQKRNEELEKVDSKNIKNVGKIYDNSKNFNLNEIKQAKNDSEDFKEVLQKKEFEDEKNAERIDQCSKCLNISNPLFISNCEHHFCSECLLSSIKIKMSDYKLNIDDYYESDGLINDMKKNFKKFPCLICNKHTKKIISVIEWKTIQEVLKFEKVFENSGSKNKVDVKSPNIKINIESKTHLTIIKPEICNNCSLGQNKVFRFNHCDHFTCSSCLMSFLSSHHSKKINVDSLSVDDLLKEFKNVKKFSCKTDKKSVINSEEFKDIFECYFQEKYDIKIENKKEVNERVKIIIDKEEKPIEIIKINSEKKQNCLEEEKKLENIQNYENVDEIQCFNCEDLLMHEFERITFNCGEVCCHKCTFETIIEILKKRTPKIKNLDHLTNNTIALKEKLIQINYHKILCPSCYENEEKGRINSSINLKKFFYYLDCYDKKRVLIENIDCYCNINDMIILDHGCSVCKNCQKKLIFFENSGLIDEKVYFKKGENEEPFLSNKCIQCNLPKIDNVEKSKLFGEEIIEEELDKFFN